MVTGARRHVSRNSSRLFRVPVCAARRQAGCADSGGAEAAIVVGREYRKIWPRPSSERQYAGPDQAAPHVASVCPPARPPIVQVRPIGPVRAAGPPCQRTSAVARGSEPLSHTAPPWPPIVALRLAVVGEGAKNSHSIAQAPAPGVEVARIVGAGPVLFPHPTIASTPHAAARITATVRRKPITFSTVRRFTGHLPGEATDPAAARGPRRTRSARPGAEEAPSAVR